ncbi:MAG: TraM recognition domain-containing protein, partial [Pseudonocardia sp.]|nr:TraM recognition domain-containing protein [Pseudonocardia sp.]
MTMLSPHTTEVEVRDLHRRLLTLAFAFLTIAVMLDVLRSATAGSVAVGAAAHVGYSLMVALAGGALVHRWWYFHPTQMFRRELGGPTGWLDRHDLAASAGERGVRAVAPTPTGGPDAPVSEFGWRVGHLVSGPRYLRRVWEPRSWSPASWWPARRPVYSPWSRGFGILGPQGSGKTQFLVHVVLDSPGAAVVSSTKPELVTLTRELRGRLGGTAVFNPALLGSIGSDFAWDPISGCTDHGVAGRRAWALVRGAGGAEGTERASFWARKAQEIVRCYLMAAALTGRDMLDVMRWANDPDNKEPSRILAHYGGQVPPGWLETFTTHLGATPNTRTGYFATVTSCVGFMDSPTVAAACRPGPGSSFSVEAFLRQRGTLYLVGGSGDEGLAPLMTALTEYVFDEAQRIAATRPGERLSPTLNFVLDEVAHTTPVPLDKWAADSRGWGITVGAVVQSLSQFATTWGRDRGKVIWENLPTQVVLPGVTNTEDLRALSYLAGERWVQRITRGESESEPNRSSHSTSRTPTREPVVSGHTISTMPRWHAYVVGLGRHPAIVGYEPGYRRVARERRRP